MELFTIVPLFIGAVFVFVFGMIVFQAAKGVAEWAHNNNLPVESAPARLVTKRTETGGRIHHRHHGRISTYYYATFELETGERREFHLYGQDYGLLAEGDEGTLSYQGTRYLGFQR